MSLSAIRFIEYSWLAWVASWGLAALWSRGTVTRPGAGRELPYRIVTVAGAFTWISVGRRHDIVLWSLDSGPGWVLAAVVIAGFAMTWWARLHLGALWSGPVTRKENHRVIDTGPYAIVRHPIYTGLLIAITAAMLARCSLASMTGAFLLGLGLWMKARLEEAFLRAELGEAYDAYARRVPMLIPFIGR